MSIARLIVSLEAQTAKFVQGMSKVEHSLLRAEQRNKAYARNFQRSMSAVGAAVASAGILNFIQQANRASDQIKGMEVALTSATGSLSASRVEMGFVRGVADKLGLEFQGLATQYARIANSARGTAIEGAQQRKVFEGLAVAARVMRLENEQVTGAFRAMEQMIAKGKIQAEELRGQLAERIPAATKIMADALGVTTQQLDGMLERGELLADEVLPKFAEELMRRFSGQIPEAVNSLAADNAKLQNSFLDLQLAVAETTMEPTRQGMQLLSATMDLLAEGFDFLAVSMAGLAVAQLPRLATAIAAASAQMSVMKALFGGAPGVIIAAGVAAGFFINKIVDLALYVPEATRTFEAARGELTRLNAEIQNFGVKEVNNETLVRSFQAATKTLEKMRKELQDLKTGAEPTFRRLSTVVAEVNERLESQERLIAAIVRRFVRNNPEVVEGFEAAADALRSNEGWYKKATKAADLFAAALKGTNSAIEEETRSTAKAVEKGQRWLEKLKEINAEFGLSEEQLLDRQLLLLTEAGLTENLTEALREQIAIRKEQLALERALDEYRKSQEDAARTVEQLQGQVERIKKSFEEASEEMFDFIDEQDAAYGKLFESMEEEIRLMKLSRPEREAEILLRKLGTDVTEAERQALIELIKEKQNLEDAIKQTGIETETMREIWLDAMKRMDKAGEDMWYNFLKEGEFSMESVKDTFLRMLAQMIHQATTQKILLNFGGSGGGFFGGGGGSGSAIQQGLNFFGGEGSLTNSLLTLGGQYLAGNFLTGGIVAGSAGAPVLLPAGLSGGTIPVAGISQQAGLLGGNFGQFGTAGTSLMTGFGGTALGAATLGLAPLLLGASTGDPGYGALGGAAGGLLFASSAYGAGVLGATAVAGASAAATGAALGSVVPIIGTIIGALLGAALATVFDDPGKTNPRFNLVNNQVTAGGLDAGEFSYESAFGFTVQGQQITEALGRDGALKILDSLEAFDAAIAERLNPEQLDAVFDAFITNAGGESSTLYQGSDLSMEDILQERLDTVLSALDPAIGEFVRGLGGTLEEQLDNLGQFLDLQKFFDVAGLEITFERVLEIAQQFNREGESLAQTANRVLASSNAVATFMEQLGFSVESTGDEFLMFSQELVDSLGGIDRAQQSFSRVFNTLFTEAERAQLLYDQMKAAAEQNFDAIGLSIDDFLGANGIQEFKRLLQEVWPTLSGEAAAEWLRAAEALGILTETAAELQVAAGIDRSNPLGVEFGTQASLAQANAEEIAALMAEVNAELATFGSSDFAQRIAAINSRYEEQRATAIRLGASEDQLRRIRELHTASTIQLMQELEGSIRTLADQLGIGALQEGTGNRAAEIQSEIQLLQQRNEALNRGQRSLYEAELERYRNSLEAVEKIGTYLDSLRLNSNLTTLTPVEQLGEARRQFMEAFQNAMANPGDAEAVDSLLQIADQYLGIGRDFWASGQEYTDIFNFVTGALAQVQALNEGATAPNAPITQDFFSGQISRLESELESINSGVGGLEDIAGQALQLVGFLTDWADVTGTTFADAMAQYGISEEALAQLINAEFQFIDFGNVPVEVLQNAVSLLLTLPDGAATIKARILDLFTLPEGSQIPDFLDTLFTVGETDSVGFLLNSLFALENPQLAQTLMEGLFAVEDPAFLQQQITNLLSIPGGEAFLSSLLANLVSIPGQEEYVANLVAGIFAVSPETVPGLIEDILSLPNGNAIIGNLLGDLFDVDPVLLNDFIASVVDAVGLDGFQAIIDSVAGTLDEDLLGAIQSFVNAMSTDVMVELSGLVVAIGELKDSLPPAYEFPQANGGSGAGLNQALETQSLRASSVTAKQEMNELPDNVSRMDAYRTDASLDREILQELQELNRNIQQLSRR